MSSRSRYARACLGGNASETNSGAMGVEVVADQGDDFSFGVAFVEQGCDFLCPIGFDSTSPCMCTAVASQCFREEEDAGCSHAFVLVIDPLR